MKNIRTNRGFIKMAIYILIGVFILSYLGFDIREFIESEQTQGNLKYVWAFFSDIWNSFLAPIWVKFIQPVWSYFWGFIGPTLQNFGDGSLNPFINNPGAAPGVEF